MSQRGWAFRKGGDPSIGFGTRLEAEALRRPSACWLRHLAYGVDRPLRAPQGHFLWVHTDVAAPTGQDTAARNRERLPHDPHLPPPVPRAYEPGSAVIQ